AGGRRAMDGLGAVTSEQARRLRADDAPVTDGEEFGAAVATVEGEPIEHAPDAAGVAGVLDVEEDRVTVRGRRRRLRRRPGPASGEGALGRLGGGVELGSGDGARLLGGGAPPALGGLAFHACIIRAQPTAGQATLISSTASAPEPGARLAGYPWCVPTVGCAVCRRRAMSLSGWCSWPSRSTTPPKACATVARSPRRASSSVWSAPTVWRSSPISPRSCRHSCSRASSERRRLSRSSISDGIVWLSWYWLSASHRVTRCASSIVSILLIWRGASAYWARGCGLGLEASTVSSSVTATSSCEAPAVSEERRCRRSTGGGPAIDSASGAPRRSRTTLTLGSPTCRLRRCS